MKEPKNYANDDKLFSSNEILKNPIDLRTTNKDVKIPVTKISNIKCYDQFECQLWTEECVLFRGFSQ